MIKMEEQKILIASHRGRFGGNIVENTLPAFEAAVHCGADMVETDVRKTRDGEMILFHDPSPMRLLQLPGHTEDYTLAELRQRSLRNVIGEPSGSRVNTLDELLEAMRDRNVLINLDQCWSFIDPVYDKVAARGMADQVLIKSRPPYDDVISWLKNRNWQPAFVPVIPCDQEIPLYQKIPPQARIQAVEIFVRQESDRVISPEFISSLKNRHLHVWINALSLAEKITLCAGHDDTVSVTGRPDLGWGWLIDHGASIIQTDWPSELRRYLSGRDRNSRRISVPDLSGDDRLL